MTRLLPTPSLWRLAAAVSPKTSDALAGGVNERVLAHPSRRQKRRRPPQEHAPAERSHSHLVILAHGRIDERNARRLAVRGDDAAAVALLKLGDAAGVVRVMMGD